MPATLWRLLGNNLKSKLDVEIEPALDPSVGLISVRIEEQVNVPSRFEIVLAGNAQNPFGQPHPVAGLGVVIRIGSITFRGTVWGHRREQRSRVAGDEDGGRIGPGCTRIWGFDPSYGLKPGRRSRGFVDRSLDEVTRKVGARVSGLIAHVGVSDSPLSRGECAIVQYLESDFDFLRRLALQTGGDLWPWRDGLWVGAAPGRGSSIELPLSDCMDWLLEETWTQQLEGWQFRQSGAPVQGVAEAELEESIAVESARDDLSTGTRSTLDKLLAGATVAPAGIVGSAAEARAAAATWRRRAERQRHVRDGRLQGL